MNYRPEIDGLRALAVVPVMLFHAGFHDFSGGFVGVDVFFVISGYLITSIIIADTQAGTFSIGGFYERRARRILPALFVVTFACLPFAWYWLLPGDMKEFSESLVAVSLFISNVLFWNQSGYFDTAAELKPLLHTWSLAVEEQYYVLFPLFLVVAWRFGRGRTAASLAVLAILSFTLAQWGTKHHPSATFFLLPTRGWELLLGALVAVHSFSRRLTRSENPYLAEVLGAIGLLLIVYAVIAFDKSTPFPGIYALVPTIGAALIILFATRETLVGKLMGTKVFVGLGLVSYSAYLWHQPALAFARHRDTDELGSNMRVALLLASLGLAYLTWRFVEVPFRNRAAVTRAQIVSFGALCSALFLALGAIGVFTNGFSFRYEKHDRYLAELQFSEAGEYVVRRFDGLLSKPFDVTDNRLRVLVIGDSVSQDLVNAIYEGGFTSWVQLSTRFISHKCGNLFIPADRIKHLAVGADSTLCQKQRLLEDGRLRKLMSEADEIWLASAWQAWQAELLPTSVEDIKNAFRKKVRVFGLKNFGSYTIKSLLSKSEKERVSTPGLISTEALTINALLRNTLQPDDFVDTSGLLCGANARTCPLFTSAGYLISHDGVHLTEHGARYFGERLLLHPALTDLRQRQ